MKALQYDHPGVPREALKLRELPLPDPELGALRLRIAYAPIHPSDLNLIEGTYGTQDILPAIPGGEASAHVDVIGEQVEGFSLGQAVIFKRRFGIWGSGGTVNYDDVQIWNAEPNPQWETTRAKLMPSSKK